MNGLVWFAVIVVAGTVAAVAVVKRAERNLTAEEAARRRLLREMRRH
jgi:hypothetical protein